MNKRLIALRPIQYLGRSYERGAPLPANEPMMVAAWLNAGSAAWEEPPREALPPLPDPDETRRSAVEREVCGALTAMGIEITDETGEFVGGGRLKEQLCSLAQDLLPGYDDVIPPAPGAPAQGELPGETILSPGPDGHFARVGLSRLTKAELLDLAEDLGVDLSGCRTNAERVGALAAVDAAAILETGKPDPPPEGLPPEALA